MTVQCDNTCTTGLQQQNSFVIYEYQRQESIKKGKEWVWKTYLTHPNIKWPPFKLSNFQENTYKENV